ncbi:MAG: hypothetical protein FWH52_06415, partial [Synergistaceae bacterium]|nr:hypothetical protein [Synergistaceae bacterium]
GGRRWAGGPVGAVGAAVGSAVGSAVGARRRPKAPEAPDSLSLMLPCFSDILWLNLYYQEECGQWDSTF